MTQVGRDDAGTEAFTSSHIECCIGLKPYKTWKLGKTKEDLIEEMSAAISEMPGYHAGFSQPIIDMVMDQIAGSHSDLAVKIYDPVYGSGDPDHRDDQHALAHLFEIPLHEHHPEQDDPRNEGQQIRRTAILLPPRNEVQQKEKQPKTGGTRQQSKPKTILDFHGFMLNDSKFLKGSMQRCAVQSKQVGTTEM